MDIIFEAPQRLKINPLSADKLYDVAIIGAGPAGMTATVYCSRKKLDTLLITKNIGGQVLVTGGIENYMGYQYVTGKELSDKFFGQIAQFPVALLSDINVCNLELSKGNFSLSCGEKKFSAKSVIITTGKRSKELGVPGEKELLGRGVAYCATCDAPLFKDKIVAVIGGGNSALTAAIDLLSYSTKIYLINVASTTGLTADPVLIEKIKTSSKVEIIFESEITEIKGKKTVEAITLNNIKTQQIRQLSVGGVFIEIGLTPNSELVKDILHLNSSNEIIIDCNSRTSVPGIFAAGDVTSVQDKQIIIAAGEGAKAALSAYRYLLGKK
ncbi:MAG: FAD-dependent oxidoreductase [Elusimicrobiota bacterium]|nr:FAD-dependent oxidoreductase [Elusimicrobiota bacterium]